MVNCSRHALGDTSRLPCDILWPVLVLYGGFSSSSSYFSVIPCAIERLIEGCRTSQFIINERPRGVLPEYDFVAFCRCDLMASAELRQKHKRIIERSSMKLDASQQHVSGFFRTLSHNSWLLRIRDRDEMSCLRFGARYSWDFPFGTLLHKSPELHSLPYQYSKTSDHGSPLL